MLRSLARADARSLGVIGAGPQAVAHVDAMLCVRPELTEIVVSTRTAANAAGVVDRIAADPARFGHRSVRVGSYTDAAACDIVCTATQRPDVSFIPGEARSNLTTRVGLGHLDGAALEMVFNTRAIQQRVYDYVVDPVTEITALIVAQRAYEANSKAIQASRRSWSPTRRASSAAAACEYV